MKRIRFGKFKNTEIALDIELRQIILNNYRRNKGIKFFNINEIREYQLDFHILEIFRIC